MDTVRLGGYLADMEQIATHAASSSEGGLAHNAFLYRAVDDYVRGIVTFVRGDATGRPPALVAVPGRQLSLLRVLLDDGRQPVTFADMDELGRNPARLTAAICRFVESHANVPVRLVTEAVGHGKAAEIYGEIVLHEAMLARALEDSRVAILCPVDANGCPAAVLEDVARTHSHVMADGGREASPSFDPTLAAALFDRRLPNVPPTSGRQPYGHDKLADLRRFVEAGATEAGLPLAQVQDLVLAVTEVATNTLVHTGDSGVAYLWADPAAGEIVCDLTDHGHIVEPLAGRMAPSPDSQQGWGLWMINQVCDLVEMRSGQWGTDIRLHMGIGTGG